MQAILVRQKGGPEQLVLDTYPTPTPAQDEMLVRVKATALNRADIMQREGKYPPPPDASQLLGLEVAGLVETPGKNVTRWKPGDRVFGLMGGGGYAEFALLKEELAMPVPEAIRFEEAAGIPEVFLTAYQALSWLGRIRAGETLLVHAGASGVGTAAIQLGKQLGARVFATASASKLSVCTALGADGVIDYRAGSFADPILEWTDGKGADVIVDFIGAGYLADNVKSLAVDGRLVMLAMLGGARVESFDLRPLFKKRASIQASTLRSRSVAYQAALTAEFARYALPFFEQGVMRPVIDSVYSWRDVAEAHRKMERNENIGKIILRID